MERGNLSYVCKITNIFGATSSGHLNTELREKFNTESPNQMEKIKSSLIRLKNRSDTHLLT